MRRSSVWPVSGWLAFVLFATAGCQAPAPGSSVLSAQEPLTREDFAGLVARVSEEGGYFDTDNLISNETGYLNVTDVLEASGLVGGAYIGVGPDQNYSYLAALRPELVFVMDVRRDNQLHHLLLKALIERAPTRIEFLAGLHGVAPPADPAAWRDQDIDAIVDWIDGATRERGRLDEAAAVETMRGLAREVEERVRATGVPLSAEDFETVHRFHRTFAAAGMDLRFTSFGRPPRPYYPTYRQLTVETDADGDQASYLSSSARYDIVRALHVENRIVPVVGDLSGSHALHEIARVLEERDLDVHGIYASNVEFYLWQARTFDRWVENVRGLPRADDAVLIRSYFPNSGGRHPSSLPGYYATQALQPLTSLARGGFTSYWDVVTRDAVPLR